MPSSSVLVAAEAISNSPALPASSTRRFITNSAIGLRHILPRHTKSIFFILYIGFHFSVFRLPFVSPLRSLSRVASDYSSGSAVCFGFLRPLRPLREIRNKSDFVFHAKNAKSAKFYFHSYFTLALEGSQTSLRQECAESLSTPLPPAGYSPLSHGAKRVFRRMTRCHSVPSEGRTPSVRRWAG